MLWQATLCPSFTLNSVALGVEHDTKLQYGNEDIISLHQAAAALVRGVQVGLPLKHASSYYSV